MEGTGVPWVPGREIPEQRRVEAVPANACGARHVPGRATGPRPSRIRHMRKAPTRTGLQLRHVVSDVAGVAGLRTIRAVAEGERGKRFFAASSSPGLSAKVSFYGLYLYDEGQVRIWPYACANGEHTMDVLRRLRAEIPDGKLIVVWDGAPYHRAKAVWAEAASLGITLAPLPGYNSDPMPVEALWRWLREDATCHHCHATAGDLTRRVAAFEAQVSQDSCAVADRLWVKNHLNPEEEKLRFSN